MSQFEFMEYTPTPNEKHLGIVKVKCWGKIVLRYKIVQKKDGNGFFPVAASYKMSSSDGEDNYVNAFALDSNSDKEDLENLIKSSIKRYLSPQATQAQTAQVMPGLGAFAAAPAATAESDGLPF